MRNIKVINALLIDDDEEDYFLTKMILKKVKSVINLDWEPDYESGLNAVRKNIHDVYLIDYYLENGKTGIDLVKEAIKGGNKKPFLMLTRADNPRTDLVAMREGVSDYLVKGRFDSSSLERAIRYSIRQKKVENELARKNKTLMAFNHMIAHDLKNPLCVMIGFLDLLHEDIGKELPEESKKNLDYIVYYTDSMLKLVEGFLAYAESNRIIKPEQLSLKRLIQTGSEPMKNIISERGVKICSKLKIDECYGDKAMIEQVFQNLIANSIKYCPPQRNPEILIFAEKNDAEKKIQIKFQDNGIGIKEEKIGDVFQAFHRLHGSEFKARGTGVGLATVRRIISSHKGTIEVESEYGRGTVFSITLPMELVDDS
ncbi:ATP-binding protein [Candidatus Riflebacteria bacterium]